MENDKKDVITDNISDKELEEKIDVSLNLNDDEKEKLKEPVKKEPVKVPKKTIKEEGFSKAELKACEDLQNDMNIFLNEKTDLEQGTGVVETLPTGIDLLDTVMGGGFGAGTFSMIVGNPGTFKSALLGQTIGQSQLKYRGKLLSSYLDSETTMTKQRLIELGVKYPSIIPYPKISIEKMFKTIECHCMYKTLKEFIDVPSIVGWDSVANTASEQELNSETDDINKFIGLRARILSMLLPKYIHKMNTYNVSLIAVNQLREKLDLGMFQKANDIRWLGDKTIPGGQALKYNAFHLLVLVVRGDIKYEQYGFSGVKLEIKCLKNKLFTPNIPVTMLVDFKKGISNFWTNYDFLVKLKRIKAGAWNCLACLPEKKFRTVDALKNYNEEEDFKKAFDEQVKEAIKIEYLDKYSSYNIEDDK